MRITYVVHARFPAEKAYGLQIASVCSALAKNGHDVTIVAPFTKNYIHENVHEYYGLPGSVGFIRLNNFDALGKRWIPGAFWMVITMYFYRRALKEFFKKHKSSAVYARSVHVLQSLLESGTPVILELHTLPKKPSARFRRMCDRCARIVCLTRPMRNELTGKFGVNPDSVIVEGDGVDFGAFQSVPPYKPFAGGHDFPKNKKIIGYIGSLVTRDDLEKGVIEFLGALKELKNDGVFGWIVGGPESWKKKYEELAESIGLSRENVRFEGRVKIAEVPLCVSKCDVCVYPAPKSSHPYFQRDTSPLKLLEYLAAGKPVVCADIPPVRDIVDESIVVFCEPGNSKSLADAIRKVLSEDNSERIRLGREKARWYDWGARMERVISGIKH